jgi:hypothetical protein
MWQRQPISFSFSLIGSDGMLDQMMTVQYRAKTTAVPTIRYQALDERGHPLTDLSVRSCYGTDRGELALTPGENTDLLYLRGDSAHLAADVTAEVVDLRPQARRENPVTQVAQLDDQGNELPSGGGFHHLAVLNPWPAEAWCRVVAVALDSPQTGPQGALEVVPMTREPILVAGRSQIPLVPPPDAYAAISRHFGTSFVTVKAYPAAD